MESIFLKNDFLLTSYDGMYFSSPYKIVNGAQVISSYEECNHMMPSSCCSSRIVIFILEEANNRCIWRMCEFTWFL